MSRIGNAGISVPKEATVTVEGSSVLVKGAKGELRVNVPANIQVVQSDGSLAISRKGDSGAVRAIHGFVRASLANALEGVTKGWSKKLEMVGVGYRASMSGANLVLSVGFSHQVTVEPPAGIQFSVVDNKIVITGVDRQAVGQTAAKIREIKKPEPYKGKGIKYEGEHIRKKAGKAAKAVGGAPGGGK